jgi:hypothetical protein
MKLPRPNYAGRKTAHQNECSHIAKCRLNQIKIKCLSRGPEWHGYRKMEATIADKTSCDSALFVHNAPRI